MTMYGSKAQTGRSSVFIAKLRRNQVIRIVANPNRPNINPCEVVIRDLRKSGIGQYFAQIVPTLFGGMGFAKNMHLTATRSADLEGQTLLGALLGEPPDISQYLDFGWYDWVQYKENAELFVLKLWKFLGIVNSASNIMFYCILLESYIPIDTGAVQNMRYLEKQSDATKEKMESFNNKFLNKFKENKLEMLIVTFIN